MLRILLINQHGIPHYRIPVYNYLCRYLARYRYKLMIVSEGIQDNSPDTVYFEHFQRCLSVAALTRLIISERIDLVISWVDMKNLYLFPMYFIVRILLGKQMLYWGQGRDLLHLRAPVKNLLYWLELHVCSAIILYAPHLKRYVPRHLHHKTFVANNTLSNSYQGFRTADRHATLARYRIQTPKNIICMGRLQKRKRIASLFDAVRCMNRPDVGLILVGPDTDRSVDCVGLANVYNLGPIYSEARLDLLRAADVCCIPGAVGLSIVDAFHVGCPFVTEEGDESAELMYLKDGINGFVVGRNKPYEMADKLLLLLDNESVRRRFSEAAEREIRTKGHVDLLCIGFREALDYVTGRTRARSSVSAAR